MGGASANITNNKLYFEVKEILSQTCHEIPGPKLLPLPGRKGTALDTERYCYSECSKKCFSLNRYEYCILF